jgi:hypothetical protein
MPLRHLHRLIARLSLAWFALALGVAAASPLVQPRAMQLVCSAAGSVRLLVDHGDGMVDAGQAALDCALCLLASAPPPQPPAVVPGPGLQPARLAAPLPPAPQVRAARAPLPARGPPAVS